MSSLPFAQPSLLRQRESGRRLLESTVVVVPMYTPLWHAARVLKTTASDWWEDGVPPARRRRQRAARALSDAASHAAAGVVRCLHSVRGTTQD